MPNADSDRRFTIDPTQEKKVILSVDGGGMRGAISIAMLAELETQTGKTCQEMFDMVAGTSTGAIIAVGLAVGLSANDILDQIYRKGLPNAFRKAGEPNLAGTLISEGLRLIGIAESDFLARLATHGLHYAYPLDPFLTELKPLAGCKKLRDLDPKNPILLVTTKDTRTRNTYFIVSAGKGRKMFEDWPLSAIVACSGAAPIFFPPVENRFLDGGVGVYTNPCLATSIEAMEYIGPRRGFEDGKVIHISLGTGFVDTKPTAEAIQNFDAVDWLRYVVLENLNDGALQQVYATRAIYGDKSSRAAQMDFRRYNPLLSQDNVSRILGVPIKDRPNPAELGLDTFSPAQVDLMMDIGQAYARTIDWSKPNQMPWDTIGGHGDPSDIEDVPMNWSETAYGC